MKKSCRRRPNGRDQHTPGGADTIFLFHGCIPNKNRKSMRAYPDGVPEGTRRVQRRFDLSSYISDAGEPSLFDGGILERLCAMGAGFGKSRRTGGATGGARYSRLLVDCGAAE